MHAPVTIRPRDPLDRSSVAGVLAEVEAALAAGGGPVCVELDEIDGFDSAGIGGLVESLRRARELGVEVQLRGVSQAMLDFFSLVSVERLVAPPASPTNPEHLLLRPLRHVGERVEPMLESAAGVLRTGVDTLRALCIDPFRGRPVRWDRTAIELDHAGIGALPIVALIAFLMGLILAMQAWVQLRVWGAEIYMADMVGVSVITEIGPLMTAIVLAARSGSSNAAQLGSMVVGEEIDALRQMGVEPLRFLVVPKVIALAVAVVGLSLIFDALAVAGGALFAFVAAGIELDAYRQQTQTAVSLEILLIACAKSTVFGVCIGVVGCSLGLQVKGGSTEVGSATTRAVVQSIFLVIVIDCVFVAMQRMVL